MNEAPFKFVISFGNIKLEENVVLFKFLLFVHGMEEFMCHHNVITNLSYEHKIVLQGRN